MLHDVRALWPSDGLRVAKPRNAVVCDFNMINGPGGGVTGKHGFICTCMEILLCSLCAPEGPDNTWEWRRQIFWHDYLLQLRTDVRWKPEIIDGLLNAAWPTGFRIRLQRKVEKVAVKQQNHSWVGHFLIDCMFMLFLSCSQSAEGWFSLSFLLFFFYFLPGERVSGLPRCSEIHPLWSHKILWETAIFWLCHPLSFAKGCV